MRQKVLEKVGKTIVVNPGEACKGSCALITIEETRKTNPLKLNSWKYKIRSNSQILIRLADFNQVFESHCKNSFTGPCVL